MDGPITTEQLVKDIKGLIEALSPDKKVYILAHDWGAAIAYLALSQHPHLFLRAVTASVPHPTAFFKSIVTKPSQFVKSWYILFFQLGRLADYFVARNNFALIEKLWRVWSPGYVLSASRWNNISDCLSQSMPRPVMYYRAMFWPILPALRQLRAANKIHTPLLYVHGIDDGCVKPESRRGQEKYFMAEHREVLLEGVGHFVALEAPDRLAQEAHRWFQG